MERETKRYFLFDSMMKLAGWTDTSTGETRWANEPLIDAKKLAFSGIHFISPEIFKHFEEKGRFSIINAYIKLAANYPIYAYIQDDLKWFDLGKPEQVLQVSEFLKENPNFTPMP
jgi:MurNAc alpha-1-phosphate uridylyltransferase